jgi:hypothetical protein
MGSQRSQAIESLQISGNSVKCQRCGIAVSLLRTLAKPRSSRIDALQKQIKWIEDHSCANTTSGGVKQLDLNKRKTSLAGYVFKFYFTTTCPTIHGCNSHR